MKVVVELSTVQSREFEDKGYVIVQEFFDSAELAVFRAALEGVIRASLRKAGLEPEAYRNREFGAAMAALEEKGHHFVSELYDITANVPEFLRLIAKPDYARLANQILGRATDAPIYSMTCRCRIDPPHDTIVLAEWHQEVFFSVPESRFVLVWAPLIRDATVGNGAMQVCVGSHRSGIVKQRWAQPEGRHRQMEIDAGLVKSYEQMSIELKLGEIVLFSPYLIHRSGINSSDEVRFTLIGAFHDIDNAAFQAPGMSYKYRRTSWDYYHSVFGTLEAGETAL
jgi:ectoine hydroxylase-related dioxygenase (phytanoyl-CoA dioxygenase family)